MPLLYIFRIVSIPAIFILMFALPGVSAQSIGAGTVQGTVTDPSGAVVEGALVLLHNELSNYEQSTTTNRSGSFQLTNVPANPYHIEVTFPGFQRYAQDLAVRSSIPVVLNARLTVEGTSTVLTVQPDRENLLENVPYQHEDLTAGAYAKLPTTSPGSSLSDAIVFGSPSVVADSNGFFHPLGDHAQVSFSVDGQPINDQQNKVFSTQLPLNALESMELITGSPQAEYGDKTSLVVNASTKSGIGQKPFGSFALQYGAFGTVSEEGALGWGNDRFGNFLVANGIRSGRFLDTPERWPLHATGNNQTFFDRMDYQHDSSNAFHLSLFGARNWFQIPNTYDQAHQDQRQKVLSSNAAASYQHTFSPTLLFTTNTFFRQDQVRYYPSRDIFADSPITIAQARRLANYGVRADLSYVKGVNNVRIGAQALRTRLKEDFSFGITDAGFNPVCVDSDGIPQALPGVTRASECAGLGFVENPDLQPGLVPFDLTRGGSLFLFAGGPINVDQYGFYVQDQITVRNLTISPGLRIDRYVGLTRATGVQPRISGSYLIGKTGTVLRLGYTRAFETPYNENLILSSTTGIGGLAGADFGALGSSPLHPGRRNQFNVGFQQALGRFFRADGGYFWKFTDSAFDFDTLLNTPITFPIEWRKSKIDGLSLRIGTTDIHGFQAFVNLGHTRARFFGPEIGGLLFNSPVDDSVFRIDHDQALQQTTNFRYQPHRNGAWVSLTWRYDSGEVAGAVTTLADALALTADQQAAIGFFCGDQTATLNHRIESCSNANFGAKLLRIPAPGTDNPDSNPTRVAPRNLFDLGIGTDNLTGGDKRRVALRFSVLNLTNTLAVYNFLSTFSGTHFVPPRTVQGELRFSF